MELHEAIDPVLADTQRPISDLLGERAVLAAAVLHVLGRPLSRKWRRDYAED
jgi:hypothetical protein